MRRLVFEENSWEDYEELRKSNKKWHKKLCDILKEMRRSDDPTQGLGKPERLKHELSKKYSRRLSEKDRLIYSFDDDYIYIHSIDGHYDDH
jgi:toxin YoeB